MGWKPHHLTVPLLILGLTALALAAPAKADGRIKPVWIAPAVEHGVDMFMVDDDAIPSEPEFATAAPEVEQMSWSGAPIDLVRPVHHLYTDLRRQLARYEQVWGGLPQVQVPAGEPLKLGSRDERVSLLRERLGLDGDGPFDEPLKARLAAYQRAHGLAADGIAGAGTIASLNRGFTHHRRLLLLNMERVRRLPAENPGKYLLVDAAGARLWMYEDDRPVDSMKVVVGTSASETPMMAATIRYVSINPYWNVPPDLVEKLIAPRVVAEGVSYLAAKRYEVLASWADDVVIDPASVDWKAVADGTRKLRVRQLPGEGNFMGKIKFMMPNEFGIYLHDTPAKHLFAEENRWLSNGCVRLEDADRLTRWLFGTVPAPAGLSPEQHVDLEQPVPVYITYLTTAVGSSGIVFRQDPYDRDAQVLTRFARESEIMAERSEAQLPL